MATEGKSRFNIEPYYDDFDEAKKFLRILFRPSYSVQARELTQLQTILNNQVGRFADHIFENGSIVKGGSVSESRVQFVRLETTTTDPSQLLNYEITFTENDVTKRGKVVATLPATSTDPHVILFYEPYTGTGATDTTNNGRLFVSGNRLQTTNPNITTDGSDALIVKAQGSIAPTGEAILVSIQQGIFYLEGFFVLNDAQSIPVFKTTNGVRDFTIDSQTTAVGFNINRVTVTVNDDVSLRDPAQGSYNFNAPGADRYKIDLVIEQIPFTFNEDGFRTEFDTENFIEFFRVLNGETFKTLKYPDYAGLEETLARRTFDESGHYTVRPFGIEVLEYDVNNGGVFDPTVSPSEQIRNNPEGFLAVGMKTGKAYVQGYEFELQNTEYLVGRKARDLDHVQTQSEQLLPFDLGNYVVVSNNTTNPLFGDFFGANTDSIFGPKQKKLALLDASRNQIGCANAVHLQPNDFNSTTYRLYLSDIVFGTEAGVNSQYNNSTIEEVIFYASSDTATQNTIFRAEPISVLGGSPLFDRGNATLVYRVPVGNTVKEITGLDYYVQRDFQPTLTNVGGDIYEVVIGNESGNPFNLLPSGAVFQGTNNSDGFVDTIDELDEYIVSVNGHIYIMSPETSGLYGGNTLSVNSGNTSVTLTLDLSNEESIPEKIYVLANVRVEDSTGANFRKKILKRKTLTLSGNSNTVFSNAIARGYGISLEIADVYQLLSVKDATDANKDITSLFTLDNGQRSYLYDHASIILDESYADGKEGPGDKWLNNGDAALFTVEFLYFDQRVGASGKYDQITYPIVVQSYDHSDHDASVLVNGVTTDFNYSLIPPFVDKRTGETFSLSDAIDHRPLRAPGISFIGDIVTEDEAGRVYGAWTPEDGNLYFVNYTHYLPRIDKILLTKEREFKILEGRPSLEPIAAEHNPENAMVLYEIKVEPYTFGPEDVEIKYIDNQRYTMRMIGELDKRITRLEELSKLTDDEQEAKTSITSFSNTFLNGMVIDSFTTHDSADIDSEEHSIAIDQETGTLRPTTSAVNVSLRSSESSPTGITLSADNVISLTPSGTEATVVALEANTTVKVNPSSKVNWVGSLSLSPSSSNWLSTYKPVVVNNNEGGKNTHWISGRKKNTRGVRNGFGTQWKWWNVHWGTEHDRSITEELDYASNTTNTSHLREVLYDRWSQIVPSDKSVSKTTGFRNTVASYSATGKARSARSRIRPVTLRRPDNSINFRMDAATINFSASNLKPFTKMYVFFDGRKLGLQSENSASYNNDYGYLANLNPATLVTDAYGSVSGQIVIPTTNKYLATDKVIRITDSAQNISSESTTSTDMIFRIDGNSRTQGSGRLRESLAKRDSTKQDRIVQDATTTNRSQILSSVADYYDPLTQTFFVDGSRYPNGIMCSSIDIYFKTKNANVPAKIELRDVVNGVPDPSHVIAFSEVTKPGDTSLANGVTVFSTGPDPTKYTRFTFRTPVRLTPGEYALVIRSNSSDDELWAATLGEKGITADGLNTSTEVIKQPYVGRLYLPQNNGTRVEDTTRSLMFRVNRNVYDTTETKQIRLRGVANSARNQDGVVVTTPSVNYIELKATIEQEPDAVVRFLPSTSNFSAADRRELIPNRSTKILGKPGTYPRSTTNEISTNEGDLLELILGTPDANISPLVDLDRLSLVCVRNNISTDTSGEEDPVVIDKPDKGVARYIGKRNTLDIPANNIRVEFEGNLPEETDVKVYVKILEDTKTDFEKQPYIELTKTSETLRNPSNTNDGEFYKFSYIPKTPTESFSVYSTKIVLTGPENGLSVPAIRNLRTYAITT